MRNFASLSDIEFEELCADLLTRELGVPVERFAAGRDKGIDLRWQPTPNSTGIVQCKHYVKTPSSGLLRAAKKEVPKVENLNPSRYLFITSQELTVGQKDELSQLFTRWMTSAADVYSGTDIDALIDRYPEVERKHVKLWLNSGSELFSVVHSGLVNRSRHLAERAAEEMDVFVYTENFVKAKEILASNHTCVIAGAPGVGKTTLAYALIMDSIQEGYVPVSISRNIEEASNLFDPNAKQIFMYDDFLGQISGREKLEKNEDRDLVDFLETVGKSPNHLFILTTREYILREAKDRYAKLEEIPQTAHVTLAIPSYSHEIKAQILYNHIWHSSLPAELRKQFSAGGWKTIVDHEGFSPRLIKYATGKLLVGNKENYLSEFKKVLDNPVKLWQEAYDHHLNEIQRTILRVLCTYSRARLDEVVADTIALLPTEQGLSQRRIESQLKFLDQTFIRIDLIADIRMISFDSPTVREFMHSVIKDDRYVLEELVKNAKDLDQLWMLASATFTNVDFLYIRSRSVDNVSELNLTLVSETFQEAIIRLFNKENQNGMSQLREPSLHTLSKIPTYLQPSKNWWESQFHLLQNYWRDGIGYLPDLFQLLIGDSFSEVLEGNKEFAFESLSILLDKSIRNNAMDWEAWLNLYDYILLEDIPEGAAEEFESYIVNEFIEHGSVSDHQVDEYLDIAIRLECEEAISLLEEQQLRIDHGEGHRENGYPRNAKVMQPQYSEAQINQMFDRFSTNPPM